MRSTKTVTRERKEELLKSSIFWVRKQKLRFLQMLKILANRLLVESSISNLTDWIRDITSMWGRPDLPLTLDAPDVAEQSILEPLTTTASADIVEPNGPSSRSETGGEPCPEIDSVTESTCTQTGRHYIHIDETDPGCVLTWTTDSRPETYTERTREALEYFRRVAEGR